MAESKRTFQAAKIDRDLDERLIRPGSYKDAVNISVDSSEDANVGSVENLKGNNLIDNLHADITQSISGLSSSSNPNAEVIGTYSHPTENKIYYFVTGDNGDGIFEYDITANKVNTILLDGSAVHVPDEGDADFEDEPDGTDTTEVPEFKFSHAKVTATVSISGKIGIYAERGIPQSTQDNFNEYVTTDTVRTINVKVKVPLGYSNTHQFVYGSVEATQLATPSPVVFIDDVTNITDVSATLNAYFEENYNLTEVGFYYEENTGGSTSYEYFATKYEITKRSEIVNKQVSLANDNGNPLTGVPASDIVVIDGENNEISSSEYTYIEGTNNQPSILKITDYSEFESFPITVGQVSSKTTISTGKTAAQLAAGTKRMVENVAADIVSPYSLDISSLTVGTEYAAIAYAINPGGTSYSNVITFTTKTAEKAVPTPVNNKLYVVPSTNDTAYANVGYGDFYKTNKWAYTVFSTSSEGKFIKTGDIGDLTQKVTRTSDNYTTEDLNDATNGIVNVDSTLDDIPNIPGSEMSGTVDAHGKFYHTGLSEGDSLTETIPTQTLPANQFHAQPLDINSFAFKVQVGPYPANQALDFAHQVTKNSSPLWPIGNYAEFTFYSGSVQTRPITIETNGGRNKVTFLADRVVFRKDSDLGSATFWIAYFALGSNGTSVKYLDGKGKVENDVDYQIKGPDNNAGTGWPRKVQSFTLPPTDVPNNSVNTISISDDNGDFYSTKFQIVKGTPTETLYTSTFNITFAKTGSGATPDFALANLTSPYSVLYANGITPTYKIGPFEDLIEGVTVIPVANASFATNTIKAWSGNFDKSKLTVSITGKTRGTDYDYIIVEEAPGIHGNGHLYNLETVYKAPAVIIIANPYILNNGTASVTHATTITYAY